MIFTPPTHPFAQVPVADLAAKHVGSLVVVAQHDASTRETFSASGVLESVSHVPHEYNLTKIVTKVSVRTIAGEFSFHAPPHTGRHPIDVYVFLGK